jgi:hypothetical protein
MLVNKIYTYIYIFLKLINKFNLKKNRKKIQQNNDGYFSKNVLEKKPEFASNYSLEY